MSHAAVWSESTLSARFEESAAQFPDRIAIGSGSWQPTYAQLDLASGSFAAQLRERCAPGSRIALLQALDGMLIGSILGALRARQTIAAFNPADPPSSLRDNLTQLDPALVICDAASRELAPKVAPEGIPVTDAAEWLDAAPAAAPADSPLPGDLAFLLRTSGSTGGPKWVMQSHRNLLHNVVRHNSGMHIQPDDRLLLLAFPSGGQAVSTIFCALLFGAALYPFPIEQGVIGLGDWLRGNRITVYVSAASSLRFLLRTLPAGERLPDVRVVKIGAEAIPAADLTAASDRFSEDCVFYCTYSCGEAGNMTQTRLSALEAARVAQVPLGAAAEGIELLLHDEDGARVAEGEPGEIVVRSPFLSPGYWRNERLSAVRFPAPDVYRTGDLARRTPDGALYFAGRRDDLVKIRGQLVATTEVERALAQVAGVRESTVCVRRHPDGSAALAAFVVAPDLDRARIRAALAATLPAHMAPAEVLMIDRLPLHSHGKIDRRALLALPPQESSPEPPRTSSEALLLPIWEEVFRQSVVSRESNFFDLGGDSLTAAVIAARLRQSAGADLCMLDFVEHPRLRDLALRIDRGRAPQASAGHPHIQRTVAPSNYPLSFTQQEIWDAAMRAPEVNRNYTVARSAGLRGRLDVRALRDAMTCVLRRHEILRTIFPRVGASPVQFVCRPEAIDLPLADFSSFDDARDRAVALLREQSLRPLDLERGPLIRHTLVRIARDEHWLLRVSHQILSDGWSSRLYFQELAAAYTSITGGTPFPQEPPALQYGDYAAWERAEYAPGSAARAALASWWENAAVDPPPALGRPFPHRRFFPTRVTPADGRCWTGLDDPLRSRLSALAQHEMTTQFVIGLAAFAALLSAEAQRDRAVVGVYMTNRMSLGLESMLGNFSRLAPLCLTPPQSGSWMDWLPALRLQIDQTQAHVALPREELGRELRARGWKPPEAEVIFAGSTLGLPPKFGDLELTAHGHGFDGTSMPWRFTLMLDPAHPARPCEATFDARLHHPARVREFLQRYVRLLEAICADPHQSVPEAIAKAQKPAERAKAVGARGGT